MEKISQLQIEIRGSDLIYRPYFVPVNEFGFTEEHSKGVSDMIVKYIIRQTGWSYDEVVTHIQRYIAAWKESPNSITLQVQVNDLKIRVEYLESMQRRLQQRK